jgi:branched-chain amino acid transport system substrate-binding protein
MPRKCILTAVLAISIAFAGDADAQGTVKIGMVMPMTGPLAAAGQQVLAGARLKQHGEMVAGKRVELIVRRFLRRNRQTPHSGACCQRQGGRDRRELDG